MGRTGVSLARIAMVTVPAAVCLFLPTGCGPAETSAAPIYSAPTSATAVPSPAATPSPSGPAEQGSAGGRGTPEASATPGVASASDRPAGAGTSTIDSQLATAEALLTAAQQQVSADEQVPQESN